MSLNDPIYFLRLPLPHFFFNVLLLLIVLRVNRKGLVVVWERNERTRLITMRSQPIVLRLFCLVIVVVVVVADDVVFVIVVVLDVDIVVKETLKAPCDGS